MKHAEVCPVCKGTGQVPMGFYGGYGASTTVRTETCRSCNGTGYVVIEDDDCDYPISSIPSGDIDAIMRIYEKNKDKDGYCSLPVTFVRPETGKPVPCTRRWFELLTEEDGDFILSEINAFNPPPRRTEAEAEEFRDAGGDGDSEE